MTEKNITAKSIIAGSLKEVAEEIKSLAHRVHDNVNQHYDSTLPYGFHLDMVAETMLEYADEVLTDPADLLPLYFAAYFHDSIEDARLTYRDVTATAARFMNEQQAYLAAEIVYALTNEKGRTRAERADHRYYAGIRAIPYAPMLKLADRIANMSYSLSHDSLSKANHHMLTTYRSELPHFLESITVADPADKRFTLPTAMVERVNTLVN